MVGPRDSHTGSQENRSVQEGHLKGVKRENSGRGPAAAKVGGWGKT